MQLGHVLNARTAPAIDGLIVVSHGGDLSMRLGQQFEPAVLNGVAVLKLIHQDVLKALLVVVEQRGCLLQKFQGTQQQFGKIDQPKTLAGFLVMRIDPDEGLLVTVAIVLNLRRPSAFFFLAVDEPLDLARRPVTFVEVKFFQGTPDDAVLIIRIQDLKSFGQPREFMMVSQDAVGQPVESADPHAAHRKAQKVLDPFAHLVGGLVGKGHGQNGIGRDFKRLDEIRDAVGQNAGFSAAGACQHQHRSGRGTHGFSLRVVKSLEYSGDVHALAAVKALVKQPGIFFERSFGAGLPVGGRQLRKINEILTRDVIGHPHHINEVTVTERRFVKFGAADKPEVSRTIRDGGFE